MFIRFLTCGVQPHFKFDIDFCDVYSKEIDVYKVFKDRMDRFSQWQLLPYDVH